jgi:hypothetical protein
MSIPVVVPIQLKICDSSMNYSPLDIRSLGTSDVSTRTMWQTQDIVYFGVIRRDKSLPQFVKVG